MKAKPFKFAQGVGRVISVEMTELEARLLLIGLPGKGSATTALQCFSSELTSAVNEVALDALAEQLKKEEEANA